MGDFNAEPDEPAAGADARRPASAPPSPTANGAEPAVTWPSGLQAPAMDTDGPPGCLDYIWVRGAARVESARLAFDRPDPEDPTLYPERPPRDLRLARDRVAGGWRRSGPSASPIAATGGPPRRTRSPR